MIRRKFWNHLLTSSGRVFFARFWSLGFQPDPYFLSSLKNLVRLYKFRGAKFRPHYFVVLSWFSSDSLLNNWAPLSARVQPSCKFPLVRRGLNPLEYCGVLLVVILNLLYLTSTKEMRNFSNKSQVGSITSRENCKFKWYCFVALQGFVHNYWLFSGNFV